MTDFNAIPGFVQQVVGDYGRVDVLINNAGFAVAGFAEDMKVDEIRLQFETNFFGQVALTQAVLPTMRRQRAGHIIMVSSISGLHGALSISSYSASKFALEGWSESLRLEVNTLGIKVVLVEPGSFQTDIWTRNVLIGQKSVDGTSPNRARGEKMREAVQKMRKRDPIEVARAIVRIAQDPDPRLRYLVGPDAHIQLWLKRILPWKWHEKLLARLLKIDWLTSLPDPSPSRADPSGSQESRSASALLLHRSPGRGTIAFLTHLRRKLHWPLWRS